MATKRTPIKRPTHRRFTPEILEAFRQMEKLRAECECEEIDWDGEYWAHEQCAACESWWREHEIVHQGLGLPPWEWPTFEYPDAECPYPIGSVAARHWQDERERRPQAFALYKELAALAKQTYVRFRG